MVTMKSRPKNKAATLQNIVFLDQRFTSDAKDQGASHLECKLMYLHSMLNLNYKNNKGHLYVHNGTFVLVY